MSKTFSVMKMMSDFSLSGWTKQSVFINKLCSFFSIKKIIIITKGSGREHKSAVFGTVVALCINFINTREQLVAARTVMKCKKTDHITPILRQLHWLPIQKWIRHKILSATYRSVHDNTPLYFSDLLQKHNPSRLLRSASRSLLDVPGPRDSKTKRYGQRAFRYVAPSLWNVLPESIKEKDSIQSFRPSLKTHFFTQG